MSKYLILPVLILGLVFGIYLISQKTSLFSKAGISAIPKEVRISNLSDNSFTVSWVTDVSVPGFVKFGNTQNLKDTALDDRDTGGQNARFTHHVTLKKLDPTTTYYFKIGSGASLYQKEGKLYTQTTAPSTTETPPLADPLFGKVVKKDGGVPAEALVYLQPEKGTVLSGTIRENGNFLITLSNARTDSLSNYLTFDNGRKIQLMAQAGEEGGVARLDLSSNSRDSAQKLILQKASQQDNRWPVDLNGDGVINIFDYALYMTKK